MERAPDRVRDLPSAILLTLILLTASQRLYATNWTPGLGNVLLFTLLGVLSGLVLGRSRFDRLVVWLLALVFSLVLLPLGSAWLLYHEAPLAERLMSLGKQLAVSFVQLVTGQAVDNSDLFIVFASAVFWIVSLVAGYMMTRKGAFASSVVPAGILLIVIQLFDMRVGDQVYALAVYIFLCLLLLGRLTYVRRRERWNEEHVSLPAEATSDLNVTFIISALALVLLAWAGPVTGRPLVAARVAWESLTRPWRQDQQDLNRTVASLQGNQVQTADIYGTTLGLGQQAQTGSDTYLSIHVPLVNGAQRYYWRVRTYDQYQDGQWYTDYAFDQPFTPDQPPLSLADPQGVSGEFTFTAVNENLATLVTPPRPIWVSVPAELTFTPSIGNAIDPLSFTAVSPVLDGGQYIVHANIYQPSVDQLRNAGQDYPSWVSDHYLQLPTDLPAQIPDLARQITSNLSNPYDQTAAITEYLRANIHYSPTILPPPAGTDALVWFLFDTKTGFCNYYATAEVVMLRSLGIPARMAVGFAQGDYQPPDQYIVRQQDAHAWPEVYFPGSGWVQFEPTSSQPPLVRPGENSPSTAQGTPAAQATEQANNAQATPVPLGEGEAGPGSGRPDTLLRLVVFFLAFGLLVAAGFLAYIFGLLERVVAAIERAFRKPLPLLLKEQFDSLSLAPPNWLVRWAYLVELGPIERAFAVVYRSLRWLGMKASPAHTPAEAANALVGRLPGIASELQILLTECQRSLYGPETGNLPRARKAAETVRKAILQAVFRQRWAQFWGIFRQASRRENARKHPSPLQP